MPMTMRTRSSIPAVTSSAAASSPSIPGCTGDIASDGSLVAADEPDGFIGVPDFFAVLQAWGPCPKPTDCPANIVDDSQNPEYAVDVDDFFFVLQNWGPVYCHGHRR
jgi:hypothetical protein